jgi:hypothetical protein
MSDNDKSARSCIRSRTLSAFVADEWGVLNHQSLSAVRSCRKAFVRDRNRSVTNPSQ